MPNTSVKDGAVDLEELLDRLARNGERIVLERDGRPVAVLAPLDEFATRRSPEPSGLAESEARLKAIMDRAPVGIILKDTAGRYVMVSRRFEVLNGVTNDEVAGKVTSDFFPAAVAKAIDDHDSEVLRTGEVSEREIEVPLDDGVHIYLAVKFPVLDSAGQITGVGTISTDITERKRDQVALRQAYDDLEVRVATRTGELIQANRALEESEERFRDFAEAASDWFWEMDADLRFTHISGRVTAIAGLDPKTMIGQARWEVAGVRAEGDKWRKHKADLMARKSFRDFRYHITGDDGKRLHIAISGKPVFDEHGDFKGYRGTSSNITAEVEAHSRTEEARSRFFDAIENSSEAIALFDSDDKLVLCNSRYGEIVDRVVPGLLRPGISFEKIVREGADKGLYGETEDGVERIIAERLEDHSNLPSVRQHRLGDGSWAQVREQRTKDGGMILVQTDITELRESEARLRQAQKMEAVGQLTGGVAHDFNNLLGVVMGNAEILADRIGDTDPQLNAILRAAQRGAELTDRLLAFSRRQALAPKSIDLDELILGMTDLLARSLGETIVITASTTPGLWRAAADPGQLENALINLAINARDAMPGGGKLVIETVNLPLRDNAIAKRHGVSTGDFVSLLVTDNGQGMSPEVLARATDPFFTTKGVGQGSGLGLSMVEGFARQSGGFLAIESSPGAGTMIKVVLPRAKEDSERPAPVRKVQEPKARGETILVVEDDPDVRTLAVSILKRLNYRVVEAQEGRAALEILRKPVPIDLILTDVVLPGGMSGPELVSQSKGWQPGVRALFMSGYATDVLDERDLLDAAGDILNKPFRRAELAERVRKLLDAPQTGS